MKIITPACRLFSFAVLVLCIASKIAVAQQTSLSNEKVIEKIAPTVVTVLTGTGDGLLDKVGSGVIVRSDGVILTAYHTVKNASQVQIRLKNGEIYDKVELIAADERRDAAALKISATNLPAIAISAGESRIGGKVFVVSNSQNLGWTAADGVLSAERLADEIPNAGRGFRVLQFSAPVSAGSSGGLLTDETGLAIGLIVGSLSAGQNLNFAIPFASINGLAASTQIVLSFSKGDQLELPQAVRPPTSIDIVNADPKAILRDAKVFYINSVSELISEKMMERALMKTPEFEQGKLKLVNKHDAADITIEVKHDLFTFDYRYSMTDRRTNILLATGKVTVWDGKIASKKFARMIVAKLKQLRETEESAKKFFLNFNV